MRLDRRRTARTLVTLGGVGAVLASALAAVPASAADPTPLIVVGTSDVYDSNLVQSVIEPGFEAAYPQYDLQYVSKGTGAAIAYAEAGSADALVVHAASLENQFVDQGYSDEQYGRAIFWGDYVLLGPSSDPAGVLDGSQHDVVTAFEKIAAAGAAGTADFVSRGGTPGTTVQEHALWADTTGVTTCTLSDANGGGLSPSTTTGACPSSISYPSWYHATGLTQGPNILNGDTCNYDSHACYVLTDRGTFAYLQSQGSIANLGILTRDNDADARGGITALVNSFHAYAISQAHSHGNLEGARDLLNWMTSTTGQAQIGAYLDESGDGAFIPSAAPAVAKTLSPTSITRTEHFAVSGTLTNRTPGTPVLAGKTVELQSRPTGDADATPVTVATTTTDGTGAFRFSYGPDATATYILNVPSDTQIENSSLNPVFGDILAGTTSYVGTVRVNLAASTSTISSLSANSGHVATVTVKVTPKAAGSDSVIRLYGVAKYAYASGRTTTKSVVLLTSRTLSPGASSLTFTYPLGGTGAHSWSSVTWSLHANYSGGQAALARSATKSVVLR